MAQTSKEPTRRADLASVWPSPRHRGATRQALLEAILATIRERGVERTRFQDVAELGGTSISTLQYLFGSRDAMLIAAFRHGVERDLAYLDQIADAEGGPWERIVLMIKALVGDDGRLSGSRVEWLELWRASLRDRELFDACAAVYCAWRDRFRHVIDDGVRQGAFRITQKPDSIIGLLFAVIDGLTIPILLELSLDRSEVTDMVVRWLRTVLNVKANDRRDGRVKAPRPPDRLTRGASRT